MSSQSKAATLDATVTGLADLDADQLRLQWRNHLGGIAPTQDRPFKTRCPRTREGVGLNAGALLVREWRGKLERVMVLDEGFAWSGRTFNSLSQVAKAITGTSWNGHRFFGLRSTNDHHVAARLLKHGRIIRSHAEPHALVKDEPPRASKEILP